MNANGRTELKGEDAPCMVIVCETVMGSANRNAKGNSFESSQWLGEPMCELTLVWTRILQQGHNRGRVRVAAREIGFELVSAERDPWRKALAPAIRQGSRSTRE